MLKIILLKGKIVWDYKIRIAQLEKISYMLIVGEKEAESNSVFVRKRGRWFGRMPMKQLLEILYVEGIWE